MSSPGKFGNRTSGFNQGAATTSAAAVSGFKCHLPPSTSQGLEKGQEKPRHGRKGLCLELGRRRREVGCERLSVLPSRATGPG